MKRFLIFVLVAVLSLFSFGCVGGEGEDNSKGEAEFMYPKKENVVTTEQYNQDAPLLFDSSLWQTPESIRYEEGDVGNTKAYFLDSVAGTKIFAYVGVPESATAQKKVPAVVLVHGGGGTAFYEWVDIWVSRGYAAIAMDTEGNMPVESSSMGNNDHKKSIHPSGPSNPGFSDKNLSPEQQWCYHALASVIVSMSFISSFQQVDATKVGITGISYGGFLTANAVGYDDRFAFAAPVYGAIANKGTDTAFGGLMANEKTDIWDDATVMKKSRTPIIFINGNKDMHFSPVATTECFTKSQYAEMLIITDLPHSHVHGSEIPELFKFADNIVKDGKGLTKIKSQPTAQKAELEAYLYKDVTIFEAEIMYATAEVINHQTSWRKKTATINGNKVNAEIPEGTVYYYMNIIDSAGAQVSTKVIKV